MMKFSSGCSLRSQAASFTDFSNSESLDKMCWGVALAPFLWDDQDEHEVGFYLFSRYDDEGWQCLPLPGHVKVGEQVWDEAKKDWGVVRNDLWGVEVPVKRKIKHHDGQICLLVIKIINDDQKCLLKISKDNQSRRYFAWVLSSTLAPRAGLCRFSSSWVKSSYNFYMFLRNTMLARMMMLENMMMTMEECTMMMLLGPVPVASLQTEKL